MTRIPQECALSVDNPLNDKRVIRLAIPLFPQVVHKSHACSSYESVSIPRVIHSFHSC